VILRRDHDELRGPCNFCGDEADAYWTRDVRCCRDCALAVLPRLMVDAALGYLVEQPTANGQTIYRRGLALYRELAGPLWRAVAALITLRDRRRASP